MEKLASAESNTENPRTPEKGSLDGVTVRWITVNVTATVAIVSLLRLSFLFTDTHSLVITSTRPLLKEITTP